ncbi:MAG: segregation/condensation protein A [Bacilli bacterium]
MDKFLIGEFEGPLDLLLHLIKQSKMDIYEIKIEEITKKYLEYITKMESMNLDIASEYLVYASELIELKSRSLLPKTLIENDEEEINPEDELRNRLLEYKKYKEASSEFKTLREKRTNYYTKETENISEYIEEPINTESDVTLNDLLDAFKNLLERNSYKVPLTTKITTKELSVNDRTISIRKLLEKTKKIEFTKLFDKLTKPYVVVTFLSILEMAKNNEIELSQDKNFSTIYLERVDA